jgi:hypothetical protein
MPNVPPPLPLNQIESTQASASGGVIATPKHCDHVWEIDIPSWLQEKICRDGAELYPA